jgi:hypothetical protein
LNQSSILRRALDQCGSRVEFGVGLVSLDHELVRGPEGLGRRTFLAGHFRKRALGYARSKKKGSGTNRNLKSGGEQKFHGDEKLREER